VSGDAREGGSEQVADSGKTRESGSAAIDSRLSTAVLHRAVIPVRWRDLDAFNHVNNAMFLSYVEEARLLWMQTVEGRGLYPDAAPVVVATHMNYRRQIEWPNTLAIELSAERIGTTSLTVAHRIARADDASVVYGDGNAVVVWIGDDGRPVALPDPIRVAAGG
jgi:YbgC/YbaW family acyl-CoA thioester hydrolase